MIYAYSLPAVTETLQKGQVTIEKHSRSSDLIWTTSNDHQEYLIKTKSKSEIKSLIAQLKAEIETSVKVEGNSIKLKTVLDVIVSWLEEGTLDKSGKYESVLLKSGFEVLDNGVVLVKTKSGDIVGLKKGLIKADSIVQFVKKVSALSKQCLNTTALRYSELLFPLCDVENASVDMSDLLGLQCNEYSVIKASQSINFSMDNIGAKVKVEVKMTMMKSVKMEPSRFVIDGPFTVFILKSGNIIPYFCANITNSFLRSS